MIVLTKKFYKITAAVGGAHFKWGCGPHKKKRVCFQTTHQLIGGVQVLSTLRFLATGTSQQKLGAIAGVSQPSLNFLMPGCFHTPLPNSVALSVSLIIGLKPILQSNISKHHRNNNLVISLSRKLQTTDVQDLL